MFNVLKRKDLVDRRNDISVYVVFTNNIGISGISAHYYKLVRVLVIPKDLIKSIGN